MVLASRTPRDRGLAAPRSSFLPAPSAQADHRRTAAAGGAARGAAARGAASAAAVLLTAVLAACSAGPPVGSAAARSAPAARPSASGTAPARPGSASHGRVKVAGGRIAGLISFTGRIHLRGASSYRASFTAFPGVTSPASSCARLAAHGTPVPAGRQQQFQLPSPPAGTSMYLSAEVSPYRGAGTYGKTSILTVGSSIVVGTRSYSLHAAQATASVTVRADGSGTFTFGHATAGPGKPAISGSVTWTCSG